MNVLSWFWLGMSGFTLLMVWVVQRSIDAVGETLFGVSLPSEERGNPVLQTIRKTYRRQCRNGLLIGAAVCWPSLLFRSYPSVQTAYFLVWMFALFFLAALRPYVRANRRMAACKRECGWVAMPGTEPFKNDTHWKYGLFYSNPADPSVTVPGLRNGMALNLGSRKGRMLAFLLPVLVAAVLAAVLLPLFSLDFSNPRFVLRKNKLTVDCPLFGTSVALSDINSVSLTELIPSTNYHSNGAGTANWQRGTFILPGGGSAVFFVYLHHAPYLRIEEKNGGLLFYNETNASQTREEYAALKRAFSNPLS